MIHPQDEAELTKLLSKESQKYEIKEFKFSRVRTNAGVVEQTNAMLSVFLWFCALSDVQMLVISGEDESVHELYEEIFLLAQSMGSGEIEFCPDTNNALKRYTKASQLIEYGIVGIHEQDSQEQLIVQMMDLVAGITGWLREHYGTYRARKQSTDRHQQMDEFTRELHMRCEVVDHMLWLMGEHMWEVIVTDTGLWAVESERVVVVE